MISSTFLSCCGAVSYTHLDFGTVDTQLLSDFLDDGFFGLTGEEHIHIDPVTGIDDKTEPAGWNLRFVAVSYTHLFPPR